MKKLSLNDKLGFTRFLTDHNEPHITINDDYNDEKKISLLIMACPAGLYSYDNGRVSYNHEGCLECGACRVISKGRVVKSWNHPMGGKGVEYTQG